MGIFDFLKKKEEKKSLTREICREFGVFESKLRETRYVNLSVLTKYEEMIKIYSGQHFDISAPKRIAEEHRKKYEEQQKEIKK
jgi:hypothetical protein